MKILHVIPYFSPVYGGPVQAVRDIARMQAVKGIDVSIATTTANGAAELPAEQCEPAIEGSIPVRYFERTAPRSWFRSESMGRWLMRHAADYDGLHLHVPFTYPVYAAVNAARTARRPFVISAHGSLDPWSLRHKRWKKLPYLMLIERSQLARARAIHVTSTFEQRGLEKLGIPCDAIRYIPLAVTVPTALSRRMTRANGLRLLFMSRLHPVKDVRTLLLAVASLKDPGLRLTVAGEGDPRHTSELHALVRALGLDTAVEFTGHLREPEKSAMWETHDLFVLPSLHENFSLSTVEAMATGMPVIVSDQVGVADRVVAANAGRVVPGADPQALARAIRELSDSNMRYEAGANARRLVEREFSTAVLSDAYADFAVELTQK